MADQPRQHRTLECALYYIEQGWQVLPLHTIVQGHCSCGNKKCESPGKHPYAKFVPNGSKDATTNRQTIEQWFQTEWNIGVCAGQDSGLVLLDIDPRHGGNESLKKYDVPRTLEAITGSGGKHLYFRYPKDKQIRNSAGTLGPGLDVRGHHGYVVAPPSKHVSGQQYRWKVDPRVCHIAPCPTWITNGKRTTSSHNGSGNGNADPIPDGQRDNTLIRMAGAMRRQGMDYNAIYAALTNVNEHRCKPPLTNDDIQRIAKSGSRYEPVKEGYNLTDAGNGERFAAQHGDKMRFCWSWGKWFYYDGIAWNCETGEPAALRAALETAKNIVLEAEGKGHEERGVILRWSHRSEQHARIRAMLSVAQVLEPIECHTKDFDQYPLLFNTANVTFSLEPNIVALNHKPNDMLTKRAPIDFDPDAKCQLLMRGLDTWMAGDKEKIAYLQELGGYCLTGCVSARVFPIFYGTGKNGKSVFCNTLVGMLGDYATVAPDGFLRAKFQDEHPTEIANLHGKRLVIAQETKEDMKLRIDLVKAMTGDRMLKGRFMRQDYFEFPITHKTILMCNNLPIIDDSSDSIWDRVHLVEWPVRIPEDDVDPDLIGKLKAEWPGIFNWLLEGCKRWQKNGRKLTLPESVVDRTKQYREDSNPLKEFADECLIMGENYLTVNKRDLRAAYDRWAEENKVDRVSAQKFNAFFRQSGKVEGSEWQSGKVYKCWRGIGLRAKSEEPSQTLPET